MNDLFAESDEEEDQEKELSVRQSGVQTKIKGIVNIFEQFLINQQKLFTQSVHSVQ